MLQAITVTPQTVEADNNVLFLNNKITTRTCGCCGVITHEEGSGLIELHAPGIYKIEFSANITAAAPGALVLAIEANGERLPETDMDYTVVVANTYMNVSTETIVKVRNGTKTISVGNYSAADLDALVDNASIIVTKEA